MTDEVIYIELNNWFPGSEYPNDEPYLTWFEDDLHIPFLDEEWVKENRLVVGVEMIDVSFNFCITAQKKWVEENCPNILTEYQNFLRTKEDDGVAYTMFGLPFLDYTEENIGIHYGDGGEYSN